MRTVLLVALTLVAACSGPAGSSGTPNGDGGPGPDGGGNPDGAGGLGPDGGGNPEGGGARVDGPCQVTLAKASPVCTGAGACPAIVDATVTCSYLSWVTAGAGKDDAGYLFIEVAAQGFKSKLLSIDPSGGKSVDIAVLDDVQAGGAEVPKHLLMDAEGEPHFFHDPSPARGASYASRGAGGWTFETVGSGMLAGSGVHVTARGLGRVAFLSIPNVTTRDPATAKWSTTAATSTGQPAVFGEPTQTVALDDAGGAYVAYVDYETSPYTQSTPKHVYAGPVGGGKSLHVTTDSLAISSIDMVVPDGSREPLVALNLSDGIHVFTSGAAPSDTLVAGTAPVIVKGCDSAGCSGSCTETGDGAPQRVHTLATAAGSTWLAWRHTHVDRTFQMHEASSEARSCERTVTADRSTTEILLAKLDATGKADVRLRIPATESSAFDVVSLAARGSRLFVAATVASTFEASNVRYIELDVTKL